MKKRLSIGYSETSELWTHEDWTLFNISQLWHSSFYIVYKSSNSRINVFPEKVVHANQKCMVSTPTEFAGLFYMSQQKFLTTIQVRTNFYQPCLYMQTSWASHRQGKLTEILQACNCEWKSTKVLMPQWYNVYCTNTPVNLHSMH